MKDKSITFLILALVTGVLGFALGDFPGTQFVRILFILFTDLFIVSLLAKGLFSKNKSLDKLSFKENNS